ncbi:hypothetical protein GCM10009117_14220 [Gangjinia marincola]|uniref:Peptidyl-prolyl cis-trans isomerase n=1 Tax=Gangjinia marincola TaxID=578463 RepID=A0ABN1MGJ7_9FLAO
MSLNLRLISVIVTLLFLSSCEDSKSKSKPLEATSKKVDTLTTDTKTVEVEKVEPQPNYLAWEKVSQEELKPFLEEYAEENPEMNIRIITSLGNIDVQLYPETVWHRANFIRLAKLGYFNETFFHRVVPNFVIQGGNSDKVITAKMRSQLGKYLIPAEFYPAYRHHRGAFAAAKYTEQNMSKASSPYEFYIVQPKSGAHHLDDEHTVFGRVIRGMDVVDQIAQLPTDEGEWPMRNVFIDVEVLE